MWSKSISFLTCSATPSKTSAMSKLEAAMRTSSLRIWIRSSALAVTAPGESPLPRGRSAGGAEGAATAASASVANADASSFSGSTAKIIRERSSTSGQSRRSAASSTSSSILSICRRTRSLAITADGNGRPGWLESQVRRSRRPPRATPRCPVDVEQRLETGPLRQRDPGGGALSARARRGARRPPIAPAAGVRRRRTRRSPRAGRRPFTRPPILR